MHKTHHENTGYTDLKNWTGLKFWKSGVWRTAGCYSARSGHCMGLIRHWSVKLRVGLYGSMNPIMWMN